MDVKVYDSEYVRALEESVVVGGHVNSAGQLVLHRANGEEFNAGQVVAPLDSRWPIGSVYQSFDGTDPATKLGGGTWTRLKDHMLIGVGDNERWNDAGETGGSEKVALSVAEMPSHDHDAATGVIDVNHTHSGTTEPAGNHSHSYAQYTDSTNGPFASGTGPVEQFMTEPVAGNTSESGNHQHNFGTNGMAEGNGAHWHSIPSEGGGQAHENMPPFTAVFMWRRTA